MGLDEKLTALLQAICPNTFCDFAPTNTPRPYVIWQQIGGDALTFIDGALPNKRNAWVQINVWSDRRSEATTLMLQIEAALVAAVQLQAEPMAAMSSDSDADLKRYGSQQDFNIWADR